MISLKYSVRSSSSSYLEVQSIVQLDYKTFETSPYLIERFRNLCSEIFNFVPNWYDPAISSNTFYLYIKKVLVRDALI